LRNVGAPELRVGCLPGVAVPPTDNELVEVPPELAELTALRHLDLSRNRIHGHAPELERCTVLAHDQKPPYR
jgi:hypothetical protein